MAKLIKNGDIILDGTQTREQAEKQAFKKLEEIEGLLEDYDIEDLRELHRLLYYSWCIRNTKMFSKKEKEIENLWEESK